VSTRTKILAGATAAAVAAGGAAGALAATHKGGSTPLSARGGLIAFGIGGPGMGMHGPGDDLATAATYLGITTDELVTQLQSGKTLAQIATANGKTADGLIAALVAAETKELDAAVSAGRITQAQEDTIVPTLTQRFTALVNGTLPKPPFGPGGPGMLIKGIGDQFAAAAAYLGISESQLKTDLENGQTLAQVATANGKTAAGLTAALVAAATKDLDAAVAAGTITQAQETTILNDLKQHIGDLVNGTLPKPPFGGGHAFGLRLGGGSLTIRFA
jgi:hypothetical protein